MPYSAFTVDVLTVLTTLKDCIIFFLGFETMPRAKGKKRAPKSRKQWTEDDLENVLSEVASGKSNVYAAKKYGCQKAYSEIE